MKKKISGDGGHIGRNDCGMGETTAGCWAKLRPVMNCIASRSKVDSSISGIRTHCESKLTNDTSRLHPAAVACSSMTASIAESNSFASKVEDDLKVASQLRKFAFSDLKAATRNFKRCSLLGEGGFGFVYKGSIEENGTASVKPGTGLTVAVKILNRDGFQGHQEWLAEVNFLGDLIHPNLVKLIGYCIEGDQRLLVYEFLPRGSLENHLFRCHCPLSWSKRMKIALDAAKGLAFLHQDDKRMVIYRDFKTSNILLDVHFNAKLSDFGLAKDGPEGDKTHVSTRVMGTYGYAAPEYVMTGHLTSMSDVYSFGVVLLEMITGRRSIDKNRPKWENNLVEWAKPFLQAAQKVHKIVDPRLKGDFSSKDLLQATQLAGMCLNRDPKARPLMSQVVKKLNSLRCVKDNDSSSYHFLNMKQNSTAVNTVMRVRTSVSRNMDKQRSHSMPLGHHIL